MRVITVARKPLSETNVARNVLKHGTGALNIDAARIGTGTVKKATAGRRTDWGSVRVAVPTKRAPGRPTPQRDAGRGT
jgi:hypothetical protein